MMSKLRVLSIAIMVLALAVSIGDTYAEEYDYETGQVISEDVGEEMAEGIEPQARTITLSVPATVTNGQVFTVAVNYSPAISSGKRTEKFIFKWPNRGDPICAGFSEKTIRIKKHNIGTTGSNEFVVTPGATCIAGTFEAKVKVTKGTKTWTAKALMEVINP